MAADKNLISIVGATGVVGQELIAILSERGHRELRRLLSKLLDRTD